MQNLVDKTEFRAIINISGRNNSTTVTTTLLRKLPWEVMTKNDLTVNVPSHLTRK